MSRNISSSWPKCGWQSVNLFFLLTFFFLRFPRRRNRRFRGGETCHVQGSLYPKLRGSWGIGLVLLYSNPCVWVRIPTDSCSHRRGLSWEWIAHKHLTFWRRRIDTCVTELLEWTEILHFHITSANNFHLNDLLFVTSWCTNMVSTVEVKQCLSPSHD